MMEIKTKEGISHGLPLSDIQTYNKALEANTRAVYVVGLGALIMIFALLMLLFWYVHNYNIYGNTLEALRRC